MYLSGSKWNLKKRRRRRKPWLIVLLLVFIAAMVYVYQVVVPTVPPLFVITPTPTRSPASIVLEAESLFQAGKLAQAQEAYQQAIAIDPTEPAYYIELARIQVFAGEYDEAVTNASNALLLDPNSPLANAVLGWALDFQGEEHVAEGLEKLELALDLDPGSALINAYYAEVLIDNDIASFDRALELARKAVQIDPNLLEAHRSLGYVWEKTSNYTRAFDAYQNALRINPNLPILHIAIGNMYLTQDDTKNAIDSYLQASALAPTDVTPLRWIVQAYARIGEFGKASQYAENAVALSPDNPWLHGDLGRMLYKNGDYASAIDELGLAIHGGDTEEGVRVSGINMDEGPRAVEFYWTYGLALSRQGQCDLASRIAKDLLIGFPDDETSVVNAQEILVLCGEIEPTETSTAGEGNP